MTDRPDLALAAWAVADVADGVRDEDLDAPTPCPKYTVRDLLGHIHGLSKAFTAAALKDFGPLTSTPPSAKRQTLPDDWRDTIATDLDALGQAWREPEAWTGFTAAGGVDMPAEVAGLVALNEVVMHGWDVAVATGQSFDPGLEAVAAVHGFLVESRKEPVPPELFGSVVDVHTSAPLLDRAVALAGRDPAWTPGARVETYN
jgi:uncharacterized protein (TIGR03086 family)